MEASGFRDRLGKRVRIWKASSFSAFIRVHEVMDYICVTFRIAGIEYKKVLAVQISFYSSSH